LLGTRTVVLGDSIDYIRTADHPIVSRALWAGSRPPLYPLLIKLLGGSHSMLVALQALVATGAWLTLGWLVYTRLRSQTVASWCALAVLTFSLSLDVVQWDQVLLTESLSLSLAVFMFVSAVTFCEAPSRDRGAALVIVALAWSLLRDSNGYVVAYIGLAYLCASLIVASHRVPYAIVAGLLMIVFTCAALGANEGRRWEGPLKDVVTIRSLADPARAQYLLAYGLPLDGAQVRAIAGRCVQPEETIACVAVQDPAFYKWINEHGRAVYTGWLTSHAATAFADPVRNSDQMLGHRLPVDAYSRYRFPVATIAERVFFIRNQTALLIETLLALGAIILALRHARTTLAAAVVVALLSSYPHLLVIWTFGAMETQRHALTASLILHLSIGLAFACALEGRPLHPVWAHTQTSLAPKRADEGTRLRVHHDHE
jgi:hypothetical protein